MSAPLEATMFAITLEHLPEGSSMPKVPPHISLIPWVKLGERREEIIDEARELVAVTGEIELEPGEMTILGGEGHEKWAQLIYSEQLRELHQHLLASLGSLSVQFSNPQWIGEGYMPHTTTAEPVVEGLTPYRALCNPFVLQIVSVIDNQPQPDRTSGLKVISHHLRTT